jgi:hypothetical protein
LLNQVKQQSLPWVAIIDHSIDIGTKKALVVLRVNRDILGKKGKAIQLEDCECIGLKISEKVNGESIALELEAIFEQAGTPTAIIKDCDHTLQKGVRLYTEKKKITIPVIEDLGHVIAGALKAQYKNSEGYKAFTEMAGQGAKRLRQTELAFLIPPKLRAKGRFQSIGTLGKWGDKMLSALAYRGRAQKGSALDKLRQALPGFGQHKNFIRSFAKTAKVTSNIMEQLKNKGLNKQTYEQCLILLKELPRRSTIKKRLVTWLERHLTIQEKIEAKSLLISSDIIESLFGKFKHVIERSSHADMNRSTLLIPAFCGIHNEQELTDVLTKTRHKDLKSWEDKNIPYTMRRKRQAFFNSGDSQKLGGK